MTLYNRDVDVRRQSFKHTLSLHVAVTTREAMMWVELISVLESREVALSIGTSSEVALHHSHTWVTSMVAYKMAYLAVSRSEDTASFIAVEPQ